MVPIPRYRELAVKKVWEYIKEIPELLEYFPDIEEGDIPDRSFMWGILGTLRREAWGALLENARKARSWGTDEPKDELIEIHPEILEELLSAPIQSKGNLLFIEY